MGLARFCDKNEVDIYFSWYDVFLSREVARRCSRLNSSGSLDNIMVPSPPPARRVLSAVSEAAIPDLPEGVTLPPPMNAWSGGDEGLSDESTSKPFVSSGSALRRRFQMAFQFALLFVIPTILVVAWTSGIPLNDISKGPWENLSFMIGWNWTLTVYCVSYSGLMVQVFAGTKTYSWWVMLGTIYPPLCNVLAFKLFPIPLQPMSVTAVAFALVGAIVWVRTKEKKSVSGKVWTKKYFGLLWFTVCVMPCVFWMFFLGYSQVFMILSSNKDAMSVRVDALMLAAYPWIVRLWTHIFGKLTKMTCSTRGNMAACCALPITVGSTYGFLYLSTSDLATLFVALISKLLVICIHGLRVMRRQRTDRKRIAAQELELEARPLTLPSPPSSPPRSVGTGGSSVSESGGPSDASRTTRTNSEASSDTFENNRFVRSDDMMKINHHDLRNVVALGSHVFCEVYATFSFSIVMGILMASPNAKYYEGFKFDLLKYLIWGTGAICVYVVMTLLIKPYVPVRHQMVIQASYLADKWLIYVVIFTFCYAFVFCVLTPHTNVVDLLGLLTHDDIP